MSSWCSFYPSIQNASSSVFRGSIPSTRSLYPPPISFSAIWNLYMTIICWLDEAFTCASPPQLCFTSDHVMANHEIYSSSICPGSNTLENTDTPRSSGYASNIAVTAWLRELRMYTGWSSWCSNLRPLLNLITIDERVGAKVHKTFPWGGTGQ